MKNDPLEPGLLSIFRLFLVIQLGLIVLNVLAHIHTGQLTGCPLCIVAVGAVGILLLLGYLSWPWMQIHLGRLYFPLALLFAIFLPLLIQGELLQSFIDPQEFARDESAWQIFLFLFFPLVLVAWQYNFRTVVVYSFLTAGLEVLMLHFTNYEWFHQISYQRSILVRTIVFLAVGYVIALIMQRQREQRQSLLEANQKLLHYAVTQEQLVVTQERNRMSRELHDTLAHTLSGLAVQLEAVRSLWRSAPERSYEMLEGALDTTRVGLKETRKAIQALRASPLDDLGISLALRNLAESAADRAGANLKLDISADFKGFSPEVEQCLYRVAQEALENVIRHAEASLITVRLMQENQHLILTIADDGCGFDPTHVDEQQHFGMEGMRERVELLAGKLEIDSHPGRGTRLEVCLEQLS